MKILKLFLFISIRKRAYKISKAQLYSNNPSDFDFELAQHSSPLSSKSLVKFLKRTDIVFLAMHGPFGEDGQIQAFLEKMKFLSLGLAAKRVKQLLINIMRTKLLKNGFLLYHVPYLKFILKIIFK